MPRPHESSLEMEARKRKTRAAQPLQVAAAHNSNLLPELHWHRAALKAAPLRSQVCELHGPLLRRVPVDDIMGRAEIPATADRSVATTRSVAAGPARNRDGPNSERKFRVDDRRPRPQYTHEHKRKTVSTSHPRSEIRRNGRAYIRSI